MVNFIDFPEKPTTIDIETNSLNPWFRSSRVTCICVLDENNNEFSFCDKNEFVILDEFYKWLIKQPSNFTLLSANGRDFDLPFLCARVMQTTMNVDLVNLLWKANHYDIMNIVGKKISLNNLAELFNCGCKNSNGLEAINMFNEGRFSELKEYCMHDVHLTKDIFLKIKKLHQEEKK